MNTAKSRHRDSQDILIRKYANRRLYNVATSKYITLDDLKTLVTNGQSFTVQDTRTGEDITRSVLAQIIIDEEAKGEKPLLSTNFLREIIRFYGDASSPMIVPDILDATMNNLVQHQRRVREHIQNFVPDFNPALPADWEKLTRQNMQLLDNALRMFSPFASPPPEPPSPPTDTLTHPQHAQDSRRAQDQGLDAQIRALQEQITALKQRFDNTS